MTNENFIRRNIVEKALTRFSDFIIMVNEEKDTTPLDQDELAQVKVKLRRALLWLIINKPFYGELLTHIYIYGSYDLDPPTMCTNGSYIAFHPRFVQSQSDRAIRLVLCHEILHCIGEHMRRIEGRDPLVWNYACDYAINPMLEDERDMEMPVGEGGRRMGLLEPKYEGMQPEDIYDDLLSSGTATGTPAPGPPGPPGSGPPGSPGTPAPGGADADFGQVESENMGPPAPIDDLIINDPEEGDGKEDLDGDGEADGEGKPGDGEDDGDGKPGEDKGDPGEGKNSLPSVGDKVRLNDGAITTIKSVSPNGDITV